MPLFKGAPPSQIWENKQPPLKLILELQQSQDLCNNLEYIQMVSRVGSVDSNEPYAKQWWPSVDLNMGFLKHKDLMKIYHYVLHAKHGKLKEEESITLRHLMGKNFETNLEEA